MEENLHKGGESTLPFYVPLFVCLSLPLAVIQWKLAFSQFGNEQEVLAGNHQVLSDDFC